MKLLALRAIRTLALALHDREWHRAGPVMTWEGPWHEVDAYADLERRRPGRGELARAWIELYAELEATVFGPSGVKGFAAWERSRGR